MRLRAQFLATFAGEAILQGPESYFLGGALRMRLIFPIGDSRWALYADGGGGMGAVDSDDTLGQGEDSAVCLLASGRVRFAYRNHGRSGRDFSGNISPMPTSQSPGAEIPSEFHWPSGRSVLHILSQPANSPAASLRKLRSRSLPISYKLSARSNCFHLRSRKVRRLLLR